MNPIVPSVMDFERGVLAFREREPREAMYRIASFLVVHFWQQPRDLADGVGVLLLTWNQAHYRYGSPDFKRFERFLETNSATLNRFRSRDISTLSATDDDAIIRLFGSALDALAISSGKSLGHRSPVAVAKALHLLAPGFFPLWDKAIADAYRCSYVSNPGAKYLRFMRVSSEMVTALQQTLTSLLGGKTHLKVIDEYNYAKFTKKWI